MQSLNIDSDTHGKPQNPYGSGGAPSQKKTVRSYVMFGLALAVIYGASKKMLPRDTSRKRADYAEWKSKGDAAGGWGTEHNHPVYISSGTSNGSGTNHAPTVPKTWNTPATYGNESPNPASNNSIDVNADIDLEIQEADLLMVLSPLVFIPSHSRPEYEEYQDSEKFVTYQEEILYDKETPHGMAFDFMLNRDKRSANQDDEQMIQRFVVTLLFYATGGKDEDAMASPTDGDRNKGWSSGAAHFLTGLHECHWVKKSLDDQLLWGILSMGGDSDLMVGVTECNADMEVTKIRIADLNLVGFIPEEIKYLSSLESFDIQNNHLAGPIPSGLGELEELTYLSLDGNNFSGTIPDVFDNLVNLERAYLNFNDVNGSMPPSLCTMREEGSLKDLWSDCGGYPITCTCCTVCCDMVTLECNEMESQKGDGRF